MMSDDLRTYTGLLADLFARATLGALNDEVLREVAGDEVTPALLSALECLHRRGTCGVGDVARGLGVSDAAGSQFAGRLESKGLAARCEDPQDRRRSLLRLTSAGERLVTAVSRARAERLASVLDRMDEDSRQALVRGLEEFLYHLLDDPRAIERMCGRCYIEHRPECVVNRAAIGRTGHGVGE